jgi:pentatricopeptide repeat protein
MPNRQAYILHLPHVQQHCKPIPTPTHPSLTLPAPHPTLQRNKPAHALRVYRAFLSSTGASANTFLATTIISHLLKLPLKGTPHKATALEVWQQLLSTGEPLDAAAYRAGLNLMVELGRLPQAEALLSRMQAAGVAPTAQCYNILLKFHCQRGNVAAAQRLFKRMRQLQIPPDGFTYNTLMMAFVAAGEPVRARAVLDKARREGVPVDVVSYTSLLQGLASAQQAEAAEQLLLEMQQAGLAPNAVTWGTLANMYASLGQIDAVRGVLHRMQQAGQPPNTIVYNTLLKALLRQSYSTGSSSEAAAPDAADSSSSSSSSSIFTAGSSDSNGAPSSTSSSDDGTTAGPLAAEVSELLRSMASQGLAPGVDSYTILLDALLELPDPASASRVFETLLQQGLQPDGVLLTCLMKLHMVNGEPLAAIKAFNQISSSPTAAVDLPAWCALVYALAGSGRMSEAEQAAERALDFATVQALPVQACLPAFGALVKGYYWQRQVDQAVRVFRRFLQLGGKPHAAMLTHVVKLCASSGEFRTARQLIRATELVGVQVDRERFDELIDRGQDRWQARQRSRQQQAQPPGLQEGSDLEKWKWWLGLPNKYYSQEWK